MQLKGCVHLGGDFIKAGIEDVGVDIHGGGELRVAEEFLSEFEVHTGLVECGRVAVADLMRGDGDARALAVGVELVGDEPAGERTFSAVVGKDIAVLLLRKRSGQRWEQRDGADAGGIAYGLFGPNQPCTRAQIVTFLWRAAGSPVVNYAMNMSDVPEGSYYAEAVRWALSEGIATGTTENTFSPDSECTRAQAVAFLFRYAASEAVTLQELVSGFSDADSVPGYALPAMNWALAEEIVQGNGSKLMPNDSCTRAQIVTFLFRAYQDK